MLKTLFSLMFVMLLLISSNNTQATIINFDSLPEYIQVTNQFSALGVTFSGISASNGVPIVITSGSGLNELDFPPHSGNNAVYDDSGTIIANFNPFSIMVGAFFTYSTPITLIGYDALNNVVGTVTSLYSENYVSSGNPSNEFLSINYAPGISRLAILGEPLGTSYVMDDFTFKQITNEPKPIIPEPSTILLFSFGVAGIAGFIRKRQYKAD